MADLVLFWHRRDLRLGDNMGLSAVRDRTAQVVGVFCLDPGILQNGDVAPARVAYMIGCLEALQKAYAEAGGQLLILQGDPRQKIPALAQALEADAIYWNRDVEPYSRQRDTCVAEALKQAGIEFHTTFWDQLLHAPGEVRTGAGDPYTVYTPFWRNWVKQAKADPLPAPTDLKSLNDKQTDAAQQVGCMNLPSAEDLGFIWDNGFPIEPGEQAALARLEKFCDDNRAIATYDDQRNFPFIDGTSRLSAALKFGAVGIRTAWAAADAAYSRCRSDETRD
ncbi:MAG: deoxyribodipyrimidine photo-lyase, partial [Nodosilinea sp.]